MSGIKILRNDFAHAAQVLKRDMAEIAMKTGEYIAGDVKAQMSDKKTGAMYQSSATGQPHQASAPGEAPAIDTSNLVNSITVEKNGESGAVVYTSVPYAPVLEFGGTHIVKRPFFTPAAERGRKFLQGLLKGVLNGS